MPTPSTTPQLTPIHKAIEELDSFPVTNASSFTDARSIATMLHNPLHYEAVCHRRIADKAWDTGYGRGENNRNQNETYPGEAFPDKQTYLNQNHPL